MARKYSHPRPTSARARARLRRSPRRAKRVSIMRQIIDVHRRRN